MAAAGILGRTTPEIIGIFQILSENSSENFGTFFQKLV
jgi:hypothetical protein